ncbi:MAG: lytic transglycosylase domain-containing protein [Motiliproteus sp.]
MAKLQSIGSLDSDWTLALQNSPTPRSGISFPYSHCFSKASTDYGIPKALLLAVARGESDFNPRAVSHANAVGLMQILWPGTAKHLGIWKKSKLYDPCTNIDAGSRYLKELLKRYQGEVHLALAAYNYGPGRIKVDAKSIPEGAAWYSRYILRHYEYVTKGKNNRPKLQPFRATPRQSPTTIARASAPIPYSSVGKLELIRFDRPYRAQAYIKMVKIRSPQLQLDWFRLPDYRYKVVASYQDAKQRKELEKVFQELGIFVSNKGY